MYKRDFGILALTAFAVYFALQNEGTFTFKKAWYYPLWNEDATQVAQSQQLPKPVVVDLNGDGSLEIVAVTHDHRLIVLKGRGVGRESGFAKAQLMAEVSLKPAGIHTSNDPRPIALAAGFLDPPSKDLVHRPRKAVIVVMTENWRLICLDHNLKTLWTHDIRHETHGHVDIDEAAILITHHTIYNPDRGLIVVGGSTNVAAKMEEETADEEEAFETEREEEKREEKARQKLGDDEKVDEIQEGQDRGVDTSRHFAYYAFEGGKGGPRWENTGSNFKRDLESLKDDLLPQRSYKVLVEHMTSRDYSEVSCRDYRESVLHSLPHRWHRRIDTDLRLMHFVKHKTGKGAQKSKLAEKRPPTSTKASCIGKKCKKDAVAKTIDDVSKRATKDGRSARKRPSPNAIVAHLREGIEAVHLYTGRSLCKLPLTEGGLHVDLDGDGVPDHLRSTAWGETHHTFPHCYAYATSGIPPREAYFNGSICMNVWSDAFRHSQDEALIQPNFKSLDVAPPTLLPVPTPRGEAKFRYGQRGFALYLNNRGDVTCFNSRGRQKWMTTTECSWYNSKSSLKSVPTLKALPLRVGSFPTAVLAAGSHSAEILSEHGHFLTSFALPEQPTMELEVVDVNGDGLNDVMLISHRMVYGYVQVLNLGGRPFGMLVLCLIVAMGTIYAAQWSGGETKTKIKRSTDRTD